MTQQSILVVDDEAPMRKLLSSNLKATGYTVRTAADGTEAMKLIEENTFDLLLLDITMPGPSGVQVLQAVRRGAELPVLMLSGHGRERDKVEALDLGADDYLTKPFGLENCLRVSRRCSDAEHPDHEDRSPPTVIRGLRSTSPLVGRG